MSAVTLLQKPVFLFLQTAEHNGEGQLVRVIAEKEDAAQPGSIQHFEQLVRAPHLTLAQSRLTGVTNAQLDSAPDLDVVLQDLLEFSDGADAWIVPEGEPARTALRGAAASAGFPGRLGPPRIGIDELVALVRPMHRKPGVPPGVSIAKPEVKKDQQDFKQNSSTTTAGDQPSLRYGTHLPHLTRNGGIYFVTFRLADSMPQNVLQQWLTEREQMEVKFNRDGEVSAKDREKINRLFSDKVESYLDQGVGECWVKDDRIAKLIRDTLKHFESDRYNLYAWCAMPNHLHAVVEPLGEHKLQDILHSWKSYSSKESNKILGRSGSFWREEYYDHLIRDESDFKRCVEYTYFNPEKGGLENWPWRGCVFVDANFGNAPAEMKYGRDAHTTTARENPCISLRASYSELETDVQKLPLPLLAEMNWLLSKTEHPLKKLLKKAEGIAVKEQFHDNMASGRLALDKLFKDFSEIIDRLAPEDGGPVIEMPTQSGSPVTAEEVGKIFGADGPLAKGLEGYEDRPEQIEMAQRVGESLSGGKHLMAEAGTGVGKSLAYLVPAILFAQRAGRPVMVSTHTKNLQSQLFDKDLPFLRKHLGIDFDAALLKGRPNYLCLRKFMYTLQESAHELDDEERAQLLPIMTWATQTEDGDVSELAAFAPEKNYELWDRLHTVGDDCLKRQCPFYKRCFVYKARGKTRDADLVVLNHSLVFSDLNLENGTLPAYSEIVFDEAHKLEDVATDHLATEITPKRIYRILNRLFRVAQGSTAGKGLLPTLLMNIEQSRGDFSEALLTSIRDHILTAMQAVQPANEGSDVFFDVVRTFTEAPAPDDDVPMQPFVPRERGRGGVTLEPDNAPPAQAWGRGNSPAFPFQRKKKQSGDDRKRYSAGTLRADEVENFTQGKEAVIARLGKLRQTLEAIDEDFKEIKKRNVPRCRELQKEIAAQNLFLTELIHDIEFIIKGDEPNYVYWSERWGKRGARIVAAPLDVSGLLHDQLYDKKRSIIFASATLSVRDSEAGDAHGLMPFRPIPQPLNRKPGVPPGVPAATPGGTPGLRDDDDLSLPESLVQSEKPHPKSFEFLKNRLGLSLCSEDKLDELLLGSPFDFDKQCRLFVPTFIPEPGAREKDFNALFTAMVGELVIASGGRAMILYTSYAALEASARILRKMLAPEAIEVLAQGEGESRESLLARLKENGRTALLGTASFWEGVDVRGEALSLLVIAKLPFAVFTDPIVQGRCEMLEATGKDPFLHFSVPQAILKLRQGFGRLIRSKSDKGIVVLADKRVLTKRYGAAFLRALPAKACTMTSQESLVEAVKNFLD